MEEVVKALLEIIKQQNDTIVELTKISREAVPVPTPLPEPSPIRLYTNESEEDLNALFNAGEIDRATYEDALREIGFYSSEIVVPSGGTDL